MRTTKPISTISFNSSAYLELKLNELLKAGKISFWAFIEHSPEDDEGGNKIHHHVYIEPAKMLQTDDIKSELKEFDPTHPAKPLGCLTFKSSKFADWYMYGLHDIRYLASKSQSRKYHYLHDDFITSDDDDFLFKARTIDRIALSPYAAMSDAQSQGITFEEYFSRGTIPLPQLALFEKAWYLLLDAHTNRNDRSNHPMDVDEDTGEILEELSSDSEGFVELDPEEELPF